MLYHRISYAENAKYNSNKPSLNDTILKVRTDSLYHKNQDIYWRISHDQWGLGRTNLKTENCSFYNLKSTNIKKEELKEYSNKIIKLDNWDKLTRKMG